VTVKGVIERDSSGREGVYYSRPGVAVVTWDQASNAVHIEWQGWADSSEIVALNESGLRALIEHHGSRLLSDSRGMKVIKQSDQDWINQDLFPRALAAGLRRVAVVVPTRDLAMINLDSIAARIPDDQLAVEYFETVEEARAWLEVPLTSLPNDDRDVHSIPQRDHSNTSWSDDVYADEPWASIHWDREHRWVYSEWKGFATSIELRAGMMKIIKAIRDHHAAWFVSDNRMLEMVASEDQLWIRDTWTPLAVDAGLERIAVVLASRGLGKFASEAVLSQIGKTAFATRTFATVSEAMEWVVGDEIQNTSGAP
jgi:hypothetical protein